MPPTLNRLKGDLCSRFQSQMKERPTRPHATVEVEISEDMQLVHFDFNSTPFELHDDNYVLKAMKFCERPQSDNMAAPNPVADGGEGSSMSIMYQPQIRTSPRTNNPVRLPTSPPLPGIIKAPCWRLAPPDIIPIHSLPMLGGVEITKQIGPFALRLPWNAWLGQFSLLGYVGVSRLTHNDRINSIIENLMFSLCCIALASSIYIYLKKEEKGAYYDGTCKNPRETANCIPLRKDHNSAKTILEGQLKQEKYVIHCPESSRINPPILAAPEVARTLPSPFNFHQSTSGTFQDTDSAAREETDPVGGEKANEKPRMSCFTCWTCSGILIRAPSITTSLHAFHMVGASSKAVSPNSCQKEDEQTQLDSHTEHKVKSEKDRSLPNPGPASTTIVRGKGVGNFGIGL
ncbi:hypothetical protein NC652_036692 [Populus alba x Populus x berolinensis]|nr:hypothetical protein NC652_036692 [Populus alba x Populus x berolinensis]